MRSSNLCLQESNKVTCEVCGWFCIVLTFNLLTPLSNLIRLKSESTFQTCAVPAHTTSVLGTHCLTILTVPGEAINPVRFSSVHTVDVGDVRAE
jgi:hypothetical protein